MIAADYTNEAPLPGALTASFSLSADTFFSRPYPSDLDRTADGRLSMDRYPGADLPIFGEYVRTAARELTGFSLAPVVYFHLTGALEKAHFARDPEVTARAPAFLIDIDSKSPERGRIVPITTRFYERALRFLPKGAFALRPRPGHVLRPNTQYAAVLRRDAISQLVGTSADLERLKSTHRAVDAGLEQARSLHQSAFDYLTTLGVDRSQVAAISVFRTHAPHAVTQRMLAVIDQSLTENKPRVTSASVDRRHETSRYWVVTGEVCLPNFQRDLEHAPFLNTAGGTFDIDASGSPRVVELPVDSPYRGADCGGSLRARFVISIPKTAAPSDGYPLLVSSHGTTGSAFTFLGVDDFAGWAAEEGVAVVSTDQPLHGGVDGSRPGADKPLAITIAGFSIPLASAAEVAFYNPFFPATARDNLRQAAADAYSLSRIFGGLDLSKLLGASTRPAHFDKNRLAYAGHSQGSQSVAAIGALDPRARAVILSGSGADARMGILERADLPILPVLRVILGVEESELDAFHPFLALVQNLADPIDPQSYARFYWQPPPGVGARSVLTYSGVSDSYAPYLCGEALAIALHATPLSPLPRPVPELERLGLHPVGSVVGAPTLRAFAPYASTRGEDGHFVLYYEPGAADLVQDLLRSSMGSGPARVDRR
jgi:hypothetical protein